MQRAFKRKSLPKLRLQGATAICTVPFALPSQFTKLFAYSQILFNRNRSKLLVFTALHGMQTRTRTQSSDEISLRLSVRLSAMTCLSQVSRQPSRLCVRVCVCEREGGSNKLAHDKRPLHDYLVVGGLVGYVVVVVVDWWWSWWWYLVVVMVVVVVVW